MASPDLFLIFIRPLNRLGLRYMVTGAAAVIIYGIPRMTHDLDLVLELEDTGTGSFLKAFPVQAFYKPPDESLKIEIQRSTRGHFNLIHHQTGFKADIYLMGSDPLHEWAMERRRQIEYEKEKLWVAPVEYVIIRKLEYYREGGSEKHLDDIRQIYQCSEQQIDKKVLKEKIENCGLIPVWDGLSIIL